MHCLKVDSSRCRFSACDPLFSSHSAHPPPAQQISNEHAPSSAGRRFLRSAQHCLLRKLLQVSSQLHFRRPGLGAASSRRRK